jgi:hypothetical protein
VGHTVRRNDSEPGTEQSNRLLNGGVALGLVQAVATRLIEGAECVRVEASDVVLAAESWKILSVAFIAPPPMTRSLRDG